MNRNKVQNIDDQYIAQAQVWHAHHWEEFQKSQRRTFRLILFLLLLLGISIGTWMICLPLKRIEPYLIRVDSTSGRVDVIPTITPSESLPQSVTRHLIQEYVQQRERYIPALAAADYVQVGALQTSELNDQWAHEWQRSNPQSPLNRYNAGHQVTAEINSVTFLKETPPYLVQVRFTLTEKDQTGNSLSLRNYLATLKAVYQGVASDSAVRSMNPLGFKVIEYRREPEVIPVPNESEHNAHE